MESLFPEESLNPPGFEYIPDFINVDEEEYLQDEISKTVLHTLFFKVTRGREIPAAAVNNHNVLNSFVKHRVEGKKSSPSSK